jgi:hypothetical protein
MCLHKTLERSREMCCEWMDGSWATVAFVLCVSRLIPVDVLYKLCFLYLNVFIILSTFWHHHSFYVGQFLHLTNNECISIDRCVFSKRLLTMTKLYCYNDSTREMESWSVQSRLYGLHRFGHASFVQISTQQVTFGVHKALSPLTLTDKLKKSFLDTLH